MALFSRWFGKTTGESRGGGGEDRPCDWIMARMKQKPMSADEITNHIDHCPICSRTMEKRRAKSTPTHVKVAPEDFPTTMVVGINGPFHLDQILFLARREDRDVVVLGNRSPAYKDNNVLLSEAPKFLRDPKLVLIFEKYPSRLDPFCRDPLVMVRRSFLLEAASGMNVETLGELAIELAVIASQSNLQVLHI